MILQAEGSSQGTSKELREFNTAGEGVVREKEVGKGEEMKLEQTELDGGGLSKPC